jgi:hypothetical protein
MLSLQKIHWCSPHVILTGFFSGLALAVAHHLFYQRLDGTIVESSNLFRGDLHISTQKFNLIVGNAFSTLVTSCLTFVLSTVYIQFVWKNITQRPVKLSRMDTLFNGVTSQAALFDLGFWWNHPGLAVLATVFWYVPDLRVTRSS